MCVLWPTQDLELQKTTGNYAKVFAADEATDGEARPGGDGGESAGLHPHYTQPHPGWARLSRLTPSWLCAPLQGGAKADSLSCSAASKQAAAGHRSHTHSAPTNRHHAVPPAVESANMVAERVRKVIASLEERFKGTIIILSCHGDVCTIGHVRVGVPCSRFASHSAPTCLPAAGVPAVASISLCGWTLQALTFA